MKQDRSQRAQDSIEGWEALLGHGDGAVQTRDSFCVGIRDIVSTRDMGVAESTMKQYKAENATRHLEEQGMGF